MTARFWRDPANSHLLNLNDPRKPVRAGANLSNGINLIWAVQPYAEKYFCFHPTQIISSSHAVPSRNEGRIAIVTDVGMGCGGRNGADDERQPMRTAKSCGPDASTPASSS